MFKIRAPFLSGEIQNIHRLPILEDYCRWFYDARQE